MFTCKSFTKFFDLTWKKDFCSRIWCSRIWIWCWRPPAPPFLYGPEYKTQESKLEKLQILICSNDKYQDVDSECLCRSSHWRCSVRKGVLRDFAKLTGKYLCQGLFFNKVAGLSLQLYLKRESDTGVFL